MSCNTSLIDSMVSKIRSLIEDFGKSDFQVFTYLNSNVWTLREPNIESINQILVNCTIEKRGIKY